ncbi:hypothetical protein bpuCAU1_001231 (plasmid) [Borrelia puertoricensis]|uniref:hypothetical protein n=1 Tax=Borrelia puertoricensis TaxID=2756107 RepID=UPI001FF3452C|nr:hypothetical protein [Borrelia puertoricensis]UPA18965.1 hypothetical protein bpuSUM_001503 [Borrelia puertoricensis]
MKVSSLVMGIISYNLEGLAKDKPVEQSLSVRGHSRDNECSQQSFNISAKDRAYYALKTRVDSYKEELKDAYNHFDLGKLLLNIPFKKISPDFFASDKQDKVYAGLGYDVEVIKQLGRVLSKLDFNGPYFINTDASVAHSLLVILNNITNYIRIVVNYYLSDGHLAQIRATKSESRLSEIYTSLEEFINISKDCMSKIKLQITFLESRMTREAVLSGIKELVDYEGDIGRAVSLMSTIAVTIWSLC